MSLNSFQQPSRRNSRTIKHAEQFKNKHLFIEEQFKNKHLLIENPIIECHKNDNNIIKKNNNNKFNGLILSNSMCKYVRPKQVSTYDLQ
ncbi:unnamed protein product, partial [Rotaria sp. Silwood1]